MIFVEDINFKMTAKGFLGKHMLNGGFGQFRDLKRSSTINYQLVLILQETR